jgi:hypothetical protein
MKKAIILVPHFGKLPEFIPYFLKSCGYNPDFEWIILSDREKFPDCPQNVHFKQFTQDQFDEEASGKLDFRIASTCPYKLCDFKPAYGFIFREYIGQAPYWGYCDLDMIFGTLNHFIPDEYFEKYDIMSFYRGFLSGPFSLFRNTDHVINLFKSCKAYKRILQDPEYTGFDENIYRPEISGVSFKKMAQVMAYFFLNPKLLMTPGEFRYQYQWYVKKRFSGSHSPVDMTDAVHNASKGGSLKALFSNELITDPYFTRIRQRNWQFDWNLGKLTYGKSQKECMAFHFQESKRRPEFTVDMPKNDFPRFSVSPSGISL